MTHHYLFIRCLKLFFLFAVILFNYNPAYSDINGRTNRTLKTSTNGCNCHSSRDVSVGVLISGPSSVTAGQTYTFTVNINKSGRTGAGVDIAVRKGALGIITNTLHLSGGELTHNDNLTMSGGQITLQFSYTAPANPAIDTIFATGQATNSDGNETGDTWNWASSYKVTVNPPPLVLHLSALIEGMYNSALNTTIKDTAIVYLRSNVSPYLFVDSAKVFLDSLGNGNFSFSNATNGVPYYIVGRQRNSIETWSAAGLSFTANSLTYSFSTAATQAFGNNMKQVDPSPVRFAFFSGDVNQDGLIDLTDIVSVYNDASNFVTGYIVTDINGDNFADLTDLTMTFNNSSIFISKIVP